MFRLCGWEKKSNTVKKVYFCVSIFVGHCEGPTMKLFVLSTHPPTTLSSEIERVSLSQHIDQIIFGNKLQFVTNTLCWL